VQQAEPAAFAVIGETVVDLVDPGDGSACIAHQGGGPMNIAIGLARLGNRTAFFGRMSRDPLGTVLYRHLERSGVETGYLVRGAEPSTIALVELSGGQARYEFSAGTADFQWTAEEIAALPAGAPVVHFGSLTSWQPPGDEVVNHRMAQLRAAGSALISYDPNARPTLQGAAASARAKVARSAALAHVIKASSDDIDYLYDGQEVTSVVEGWLGQGAALVVITSGSAGATAWVPGRAPVKRPAFPTRVVDTVGAGDAFMSGLLDGLGRRGLATPAGLGSLADPSVLAGIIDDAGAGAAITCSRAGANPPTRAEVDAFLVSATPSATRLPDLSAALSAVGPSGYGSHGGRAKVANIPAGSRSSSNTNAVTAAILSPSRVRTSMTPGR
jgi:fructokinase